MYHQQRLLKFQQLITVVLLIWWRFPCMVVERSAVRIVMDICPLAVISFGRKFCVVWGKIVVSQRPLWAYCPVKLAQCVQIIYVGTVQLQLIAQLSKVRSLNLGVVCCHCVAQAETPVVLYTLALQLQLSAHVRVMRQR